MFLSQELKRIQALKKTLSISSDLRRRQAELEVQELRHGTTRTVASLTVGLAMARQVLGLLRRFAR